MVEERGESKHTEAEEELGSRFLALFLAACK